MYLPIRGNPCGSLSAIYIFYFDGANVSDRSEILPMNPPKEMTGHANSADRGSRLPGTRHTPCGRGTPLTNDDIVQAQDDPGTVIERYWPGGWQVLERAGVEAPHSRFWPVTRIERARAVLGWEPEVCFADYLRSLGWEG